MSLIVPKGSNQAVKYDSSGRVKESATAYRAKGIFNGRRIPMGYSRTHYSIDYLDVVRENESAPSPGYSSIWKSKDDVQNELIKLCRNRAFDKLYERMTVDKNELGMAIATSGQTYRWLVDRTKSILDLTLAAKRSDLGGFVRAVARSPSKVTRRASKRLQDQLRTQKKRRLNEAAGLWLEWNYAVNPLVGEIENLLMKDALGITEKFSVKTGASRTKTITPNHKEVFGFDSVEGYSSSIGVHVKLNYKVTYKIGNELARLNQHLGLNNSFTVINDLIPFSFLVNQITNHERYLQQLDIFSGLKEVVVEESILVKWYANNHYTLDEGLSGVNTRGFDFTRYITHGGLPNKITLLDGITTKPITSWQRAANDLALVVSMITK